MHAIKRGKATSQKRRRGRTGGGGIKGYIGGGGVNDKHVLHTMTRVEPTGLQHGNHVGMQHEERRDVKSS